MLRSIAQAQSDYVDRSVLDGRAAAARAVRSRSATGSRTRSRRTCARSIALTPTRATCSCRSSSGSTQAGRRSRSRVLRARARGRAAATVRLDRRGGQRSRDGVRPADHSPSTSRPGSRADHRAVARRERMSRPVTLIPGDGIGPSITERHRAPARRGGRRHRVGPPARRAWPAVARVRRSAPRRDARLASSARSSRSRARSRRRSAKGFRSINVALRQDVRSLRERPAGAHDRARRLRYRRRRPRARPREHRRAVHRRSSTTSRSATIPRAAAESMAIITRFGSERIVRYAFEYAVTHGRKKVTLVHKANILKYSQGLFLEVGPRDRARVRGPRSRARRRSSTRCAMKLVLRPERFDVIVTTNLFGDILSRPDLGARRRARPRARREHRRERARSSRRCTARRPTSPARASRIRRRVMLAACQLLDHMGDARARRAHARGARDDAPRAEDASRATSAAPRRTDQFTDAVIANLRPRADAAAAAPRSDLHFGRPSVPEQVEAIEALIAERDSSTRRDLGRPLAAHARGGVPARARVHRAGRAARHVLVVPGNHDVAWWMAPLGLGSTRGDVRDATGSTSATISSRCCTCRARRSSGSTRRTASGRTRSRRGTARPLDGRARSREAQIGRGAGASSTRRRRATRACS